MRGWLVAPLVLVALVGPLAAAQEPAACRGGETDTTARPLPNGYYLTTGEGGALELWKERNAVGGLQRSMLECVDGSFVDADFFVARSGGLCLGTLCGV